MRARWAPRSSRGDRARTRAGAPGPRERWPEPGGRATKQRARSGPCGPPLLRKAASAAGSAPDYRRWRERSLRRTAREQVPSVREPDSSRLQQTLADREPGELRGRAAVELPLQVLAVLLARPQAHAERGG